ncbi:hypothetical protein LCGC14_1059580 [marine sediment metagenome]|uniref:HNH nuclease domain-containing protein n=1 Tax=marine sediment metagenome TaxID=412755 RepID=A0A0F9Q4D1_9ZZZZ
MARKLKTIRKNCDKLYREIITVRDEGRCQWCQKNTGQAVHHIIPRSKSAVLFHDLLNLILLCTPCHFKYHKDEAAGIYWFETTFSARWEYLHYPICDEWGKKLPRRNIIKSSWKKSDYEEIELSLKEKLAELKG